MGFQGDPRLTRLDCQSTANGLVLRSCPNIQSLLSTAARSQVLSSELRDAALQYVEADVVPYPVIRDVWVQLTPGYGVPFHQVLAGSSFVLESPKPREKSKELKDRLARLQELADKKAYSELVKDVTNNDRHEDREYFSSYKNSLGFGLHVLVIMFTGYMFGYAIVRSQFPDYPAMVCAHPLICEGPILVRQKLQAISPHKSISSVDRITVSRLCVAFVFETCLSWAHYSIP
ncbi:hypothetical protein M758_8G097800 [Ceratodon purpureus]|nr:hypothetical protein M758_8G097800 [Ceratodon purpureus]